MPNPKWPRLTNWKVTLGRDCSSEEEGLMEVQQLRSEIESLRQQLAAKDSTICGLRAALENMIDLWTRYCAPRKVEFDSQIIEAREALSSSPTCPHKEEVEYQKKRVSELEEPMKCDHYGANLQPDDSNADVCVVCVEVADLQAQLASSEERAMMVLQAKNVWADRARKAEAQLTSHKDEVERLKDEIIDLEAVRCEACIKAERSQLQCIVCEGPFTFYDEPCHKCFTDLQAELAALRADNENLLWNLAGCNTYAMGYGLETEHDSTLARPALDAVRKMALELAFLQKGVKDDQ